MMESPQPICHAVKLGGGNSSVTNWRNMAANLFTAWSMFSQHAFFSSYTRWFPPVASTLPSHWLAVCLTCPVSFPPFSQSSWAHEKPLDLLISRVTDLSQFCLSSLLPVEFSLLCHVHYCVISRPWTLTLRGLSVAQLFHLARALILFPWAPASSPFPVTLGLPIEPFRDLDILPSPAPNRDNSGSPLYLCRPCCQTNLPESDKKISLRM